MPTDEIAVLLRTLCSAPIDDASSLEILSEAQEGSKLYRVTVSEREMGKLIVREGRNANAVRIIAKSTGIKLGCKCNIENGEHG